jgi:stage III sporulation protein AE
MIRKTLTIALASAAGLFTGFLSLKSILSSSADGLANKGIKLAANTFIPVIGGAIGEAYTSIIGSLGLLKNTVGIYAVIVFLFVCIPVVINLAIRVVSLRAASAVADLLDCRVCTEILRNISFFFSMINTILLLCMAVFVISTGLIVVIKTGG